MTPGVSRPAFWKGAGVLAVLILGLSGAQVVGTYLQLGDLWPVLALPVLVLFFQQTRGWGAWSSVLPLGLMALLVLMGEAGVR